MGIAKCTHHHPPLSNYHVAFIIGNVQMTRCLERVDVMRYWQMALREREGVRKSDRWPDCFKKGIAAIGYQDDQRKPIVEDCSKLSKGQYHQIWRSKWPQGTNPQASLRRLAYEMNPGDIIYVRNGLHEIVGKGKIIGGYKYDPNILGLTGWDHYVRVDWEKDFRKLKGLNLHAPRTTVFELTGNHLKEIQASEKREGKAYQKAIAMEVQEGEKYKTEVEFRKRNAALIAQKKRESNYCCEVCHMSFEETYGNLGKGHIIAHHLDPIAMRKRPSKTSLKDLALVCSNCHDMLHSGGLHTVEELRVVKLQAGKKKS